MRKNILLVINPISGAIDKSEFIDAALLFSAKRNKSIMVFSTTGEDDISKIKTLYNKHKFERIIIAGGDGTIKMVAEAVENKDVILGILPAGSANGLAMDLDLVVTLEENMAIAFGDSYAEIDIITINGERCLHLSDIGLNAELIKNYEKSSVRGKWGYVLQVFNTLIDMEGLFTATIAANNQKTACVARMIVIANAKKYGTGVVINPSGVMNDGKFELVILKNLDLMIFAQIISGNMPINSEDIEVISTDSATITIASPVPLQIDGEYFGATTQLDIKILPRQIKVATL
ncbi:diacylglycerol/lipid kinase family protein [Flavobacterium psychrotolerans]|uniref:Diacylglycerol kinase n=1 Tax=Flavobacterium psychrotolerans TaxID=2169410 RepID=A0A2U1JG35_9FLAO|nr:diacylglycerol kinase family protein [Flavobacterium psychrotolerans]PWA03944.1 diacylglycerol kinase [Flavobacterium psychrotolerans]